VWYLDDDPDLKSFKDDIGLVQLVMLCQAVHVEPDPPCRVGLHHWELADRFGDNECDPYPGVIIDITFLGHDDLQ
jgi:hypothetical protein